MRDIELKDYDYDLPEERIAQYPVKERDNSRILLYDGNEVTSDIFKNIYKYIPSDSLLVFNNTRVIRARILFHKDTGSTVEVFCLEPLLPSEYELSLSSGQPVEWKCIIGNLKKWKSGKIKNQFGYMGDSYELTAEKIIPEGEAWRIRFSWNNPEISFGEVIEATGHIPLPPYINRQDEENDNKRYQTIYSSVNGSVAAPTAGLHFTNEVFERFAERGIKKTELTLHVGAGTFQPVRTKKISDHEMHCEHFFVPKKTIEILLEQHGRLIPVGTTSVRTLESLYWLGVRALNHSLNLETDLTVGQWEPYESDCKVSSQESLAALSDLMKKNNRTFLTASTKIMIIPGYDFRMISGLITNFHQPRSTLLLLISAWVGKNWKKIYRYALENDFRFLSYGDSSLLFR